MPRTKKSDASASGPPPFAGNMLSMMDLAELDDSSWDAWRSFWRAGYALLPSPRDLELYHFHTGRQTYPTQPFREIWMVIGRGGGKSINAGLVALFLAISRDYTRELARGGVAVIPLVGGDQKQARLVLGYIKGLCELECFAKYVAEEPLADSITFTTGARIEIKTASYRTIRGFTLPALVADELAFWRSDDSAEPDEEILRAAKPGMARLKDSKLIALSSPYAKKGALYRAVRDFYGKDQPRVLVWNASTLAMNPTFADPAEIDAAFEDDPAKAMSEYGHDGHVAFRADIESFVDPAAVEAVTIQGRHELPPQNGIRYYAFTDPSGGSQDAWPTAIAYFDHQSQKAILAAMRTRQPPFDPFAAVAEHAPFLKSYGITEVEGDHFAGQFPRTMFRQHGITYRTSDKPKSDIYQECLPLLNAGRVELLESQRLKAELCGLERQTSRSGKDSIDHAPGGHDDIANAVAGVLVRAALKRPVQSVRFAL